MIANLLIYIWIKIKKIINFAPCFADVAELVDAPDLGSGAVRRGGSSPFVRTAPPAIPVGICRRSL